MAKINNRDDYQKWYEEYITFVEQAKQQVLGPGNDYMTIKKDWDEVSRNIEAIQAKVEENKDNNEKLKNPQLDPEVRDVIKAQMEQSKRNVELIDELKTLRSPINELLDKLEARGSAVKPRNFGVND